MLIKFLIEFLDVKFNVEEITPEQGSLLNKIGLKYNIGGGVFLKLLRLDYKEQDNNAQIKEIDKAKLALSVCNYFYLCLFVNKKCQKF